MGNFCNKSYFEGPKKETKFNEEKITELLEQVNNDPEISKLEQEVPCFEFVHNYYFEGTNNFFRKINYDYEGPESVKRVGVSQLTGNDSNGIWVYTGECLVGSKLPDGRGILVHLGEKTRFIGYFHEGRKNGFGRLVSREKLLEGDWFQGVLNGQGKEVTKSKCSYTGGFRNGAYEGLGKAWYGDGSSYTGEFKQGEREGYGEYIWQDNSKYQGDWKEGKLNGQGTYTDKNGNYYEGEWKDNKMDGFGEFTWSDGKKYKGNYFEDQKHGYGEFYWPNGKVWRGNWAYGKRHGQGESRVGGVPKVGIWQDDVFQKWIS